MSELRVFSFNIWTDGRADGGASSGNPRCFAVRREIIKEKLPAYAPDIVGFQETMPAQRQWLIDNFPDYQVCGLGRNADLLGESNVIMFKKDKFDLYDLNMFWLSDTPGTPGTRFMTDQSDCPRICVAATLRDKATGKMFRHYNTHLDHVGPIAMAQGITVILNRMAEDYKKWPMPVILTGDMNATPESPVIKSILAFTGAGEKLEDKTAPAGFTFHNNNPEKTQIKIDYVFTNLPSTEAMKMTDEVNGITVSDHYPVGAVLEL
ncbi:MAG: endonuclease/exonuclease/phosphatase family protein [Clostridia bacterium]|nr:endonuclease/exonuclease/phosphatase family protein [Clostridia bacterium]MBP3294907.1 endonuclease/exonuclease/phosphatase family protein [Clostridia bacterium]